MTDTQPQFRFSLVPFPQETIRQRLVFSIVLIGLILTLIVTTVFWQINGLNDAVLTLQRASIQVAVVVEVRQDSNELLAVINRLLPVEDATIFESEVSPLINSLTLTNADMATFVEAETGDETFDTLMNSVSGSVESIVDTAGTMVRQANAGQWPSVQVRIGVLTRDHQQLSNEVSRLVRLAQEREQALGEELAAARRTAVFSLSLLLLISLSVLTLLLRQTIRSVIKPVEQLSEGVAQLSAGAFHERIVVERHDELGQLAIAFNEMAEQLQVSRAELEQRVFDQTRALETSIEVSRRLSTILDPQKLVVEIVTQIQQAFNYYHVHIYLLDRAGEYLVMMGGTGAAGSALLDQGHKIAMGQGLVGRAATTNSRVLVSDVTEEKAWLPNPLLPQTKAEAAIPIAMRNDVLGVLDVQHDVKNGLTEKDIYLLQSVADQAAIALRNSRLYADAQVQATRKTMLNDINRRIQMATDVDTVLQIAAREVGKALGAKQVDVQIGKPLIVENRE